MDLNPTRIITASSMKFTLTLSQTEANTSRRTTHSSCRNQLPFPPFIAHYHPPTQCKITTQLDHGVAWCLNTLKRLRERDHFVACCDLSVWPQHFVFRCCTCVGVPRTGESLRALSLFTGKRQGCSPMLHHVAVGRHVGGQAEVVVVVVVGDVQNASSVRNEETLVDRRF